MDPEANVRLLYITPRFPYPPHKGDQVVTYHRLRLLGRKHEITLVTLIEEEQELEGLDAVQPYCAEVIPVLHPRLKSVLRVGLGLLQPGIPLQVSYFSSTELFRQLRALRERRTFDLVNVFTLRTAPYGRLFQVPRVIDLIDSMQLNLDRRIRMDRSWKRYVLGEELRRIRNYETVVCQEYDGVAVVAEKDRETIGADKIALFPNGVDTDTFRPLDTPKHPHSVIFSGNMGYAPNIHAVRWFAAHCLGPLREKYPEAQLIIAGGNPAPEIQDLARLPGVTVTGFVDSMPAALNSATISIAPMQSGSGIQNKILEAMACGMPCVVNRLGLGSIKARHGSQLLVGDTPEEFVGCLDSLFRSPAYAGEVGSSARKFVMEHHSWESTCDRVEALYRQVLDPGLMEAVREREPEGGYAVSARAVGSKS
jgi:sugar transferase (PEP-CTERM/EpsH1 system associated)